MNPMKVWTSTKQAITLAMASQDTYLPVPEATIGAFHIIVKPPLLEPVSSYLSAS